MFIINHPIFYKKLDDQYLKIDFSNYFIKTQEFDLLVMN